MSDETRNPGRDPGSVDPDVAESLQGSNPAAAGDQHLAGGMGVSSERVGHAGPGQEATDGLRDSAPHPVDPADAPPEQSAGPDEPANPAQMGRRSTYPSKDPRSEGEEPDHRGSELRGGPGTREG